MTDATVGQNTGGALLKAPGGGAGPQTPVIVEVAKRFRVSPLRQFRETLALRVGPQKLRAKDYYDFGLYDPELPMAEKKTYVGLTGNAALNARLSPPALIPTGAFVGNKVLYTALLAQLGLATTETQAVASTHRTMGKIRMLRDASAVADFLAYDAVYPVFGKPHHGSLSAGSVRLEGCAGGELTLGNGKTLRLEEFAAEVMRDYPGGFLFQTALLPHPEMAEVTGQAVGCVRIVTVMDGETPRPLYALWKIPSPTAMSDNFWQAGSMLAEIDLETGTIKACRRGTGPRSEWIEKHPVSGARITGRKLPQWDAVQKLATDAHAVFPEFGVCGWDIAITPDGPAVIECNDNPMHTLFQLSARRGIWNADFAPVWKAVETRQAKKLAKMAALRKKIKGGGS